MIRPIRLTDLSLFARQQHVEYLYAPDTLIQEFSPTRFAARSTLGRFSAGAETLVATRHGYPTTCCYTTSPRSSDEVRVLAFGQFGGSDSLGLWDRLLERACLRAAGEGKLRVVARPRDGSPAGDLMGHMGFTPVTREHVYVRKCGPLPASPATGVSRLTAADVWDCWKLYNRVEPATVQRAEGITASLWKERAGRASAVREEWLVRSAGEVACMAELTHGRRASALSLTYSPEQSHRLPGLVVHSLSRAASRQAAAVYCCIREHQVELERTLEALGFHYVQTQVQLVLYTSVLSLVADDRLAHNERPARALSPSVSHVSYTTPDELV